MTIIIPMAGLGSRFCDAGYKLPKPLIPVGDRPMYAWAAESLPLAAAKRLVFVVLSGMPAVDDLCADINTRYAHLETHIVTLPALTQGQALSVLAARHLLPPEEPLLIHNADTAFIIQPGWESTVLEQQADGAILVFPSSEERWSYAREDTASGLVAEVQEKVVISPWATVGAYWFRRAADFMRLADEAVTRSETHRGEYYVGPLYNQLIASGGQVALVKIDQLMCFGTPKDYLETLRQMGLTPPLEA